MPTAVDRIIIAGAEPIVRYGLTRLLAEHGIPATAIDAPAADLAGLDFSGVDVLLLAHPCGSADVRPDAEALAARFPRLRILLHDDDAAESLVPSRPTVALLPRSSAPEAIVASLRELAGIPAPSSASKQRISGALSTREREILRLLAGGRKPVEIARLMDLRIGTVTSHTHRIKKKLGARSLGELVLMGNRLR